MNRRDWKRARQRRQDDLLDRLVRERRPERLETLARYRLGTATADELAVLVKDVILDELMELGLGADRVRAGA